MRALITRPAEDAQEIADALRARGFAVVIEPMLEIVPLDAPAPDLFDVQALLFTSVNGVRALTRLVMRRDLPVFAVGNATAAAARAAGFTSVHSAGGDTGDLARLVRARLQPDAGALLHVSGSAVAGDLADALAKDGFHVRREMLYEARPATALSPALLQHLKARGIDLVLFFSPRTARTFVSLVRDAGLDASLDRAIAICLSHAVAAALSGLPLRAVRVAARPELAALLAEIGSPGGDVIEPRKEQALPTTATPRRRGRAVWLAVLVLALALIYATAPHWRGALPAEWQARLDPYLPAGSSGGAGALEAEIAQLKATGAAREGALGALIFALNRRVDGLEQSLKNAQPSAAQTGQPAGADPALSQRLDSMERTLAELQNRPVPAQPATPDPALGQRLESVERAVAALKTASAATGATPQSSDPQELRALESRVIGLEARPAAPDLRPLIERIAALEARPAGPDSAASSPDFVRLAGRLALVETAVAEAARRRAEGAQPQRPPAAAFVLAVTQLREAMRRAAPYAGELESVKALAGDDPPTAEPIKTLEPRAARGVPTEESLVARFDPVTLQIVRADRAPAGNVADRALSRLTELVSVRRIGDTDAATTDGILARAETRLRGGDLAGAVDALAQLQGPAAAPAAEWLADARARLAADAALSRLTNVGVARIAAGSTPPASNPPRQAGE